MTNQLFEILAGIVSSDYCEEKTLEQSCQQQLLAFAQKLIADGFRVFHGGGSWLYFAKGDDIGYCDNGYFGTFSFDTVHRPCTRCGTGFNIAKGIDTPTSELATACFVTAPNWASQYSERGDVRKYQNIDVMIAGKSNAGSYKELTAEAQLAG